VIRVESKQVHTVNNRTYHLIFRGGGRRTPISLTLSLHLGARRARVSSKKCELAGNVLLRNSLANPSRIAASLHAGEVPTRTLWDVSAGSGRILSPDGAPSELLVSGGDSGRWRACVAQVHRWVWVCEGLAVLGCHPALCAQADGWGNLNPTVKTLRNPTHACCAAWSYGCG